MLQVPLIAAQPTAMGQEIHRIANLDGRLYLAYGDYGVNTGPIHALALDPANDSVTDEATLHTEQTWTYRVYGGVRYVAYMDPQGGDADFANGQYASNSGTGWVVHTNVTPVPVHVFDLLKTADGLWLFGAANSPDPPNGGATVWLSTDDGASWSIPLAPRPDPTNWARFYAACELEGDLFAVEDDGAGNNLVYRRHLGAWSQVEALPFRVGELVPYTINGVPFALVVSWCKQPGMSADSPVLVLTTPERVGQRAAVAGCLPVDVRDAGVYGGDLYVLDGASALWRITADGTKTELFTSTVPVVSFAISGTDVYFGSTDSKVYKTGLPT